MNSTPISAAAFHILLALADGERHGYGIMQEVEARTAGELRLGPGTLYGAIKRLRQDGWIEEVDGPAEQGEERRRYYRLTPLGRRGASAEAQRLEAMVSAARSKRILGTEGA